MIKPVANADRTVVAVKPEVSRTARSLSDASSISGCVGHHREADVIVIGSGAGGAIMAWKCVKAGKRVLLIERGKAGEDRSRRDERTALMNKVGYDDRDVDVNGDVRRLYIGGTAGGGTALYGAALLRPSVEDFRPGRHYGDRLPRCRWDWPISYDALQHHYEHAERLFGVSRDETDDFSPLQPPGSRLANAVIPLAPINRRLVASSRSAGWNPFRLPLAIDGRTCLRCSACAGYRCPNGSRRSAADLLVESQQTGRLQVLDNTEVIRLVRGVNGEVTRVRTRSRGDATIRDFSATRYVLAAGALGSAAILLRSELGGSRVGCGYMYHFSPVVAGVFARPTDADRTFVKQVGFADHYFGTSACAEKIGIVQSLPAPGPLMMRKNGPRVVPTPMLRALRRRMLPLLGIVEDLPDPSNRVTLCGNQIRLRHRFSEFDRVRGAALARQMIRILRRAGAVHCIVKESMSAEHVAHQCGTLAMAARPGDGVVDPSCRLFGTPNLFVTDGSVLPTSLGVGPALTIMANSLRVAEQVIDEC